MMGTEIAKIVGLIGKKAVWHLHEMEVKVLIKDVRIEWGRVRYLIESDMGTTRWVDQENISELAIGVVKGATELVKHFF